jgi:hypothetical protein
MLKFYSSSTRIVNTRRGVQECMEAAMGDNYKDCSLLIFNASIGHDFGELVSEAKSLAPQATVLAASCCGVIGREGVSESMKDIALMAVKGDEFSVEFTPEIYGHNSYEECLKMATKLKAKNPDVNMLYFLASGIDIANDLAIKAFEDVFGSEITIFGATSADNMKGYVNYQAVDLQVFEHAAYLVGFSDPTLKVETRATHGFVAIGEPLVVTSSEGHIIKEFNNKPAWSEYIKRLGLDNDADCGDTIPIGALGEKLSDELAKEYGNDHLLRVVTKSNEQGMYYATGCPIGTELWLTDRDEDLIFSEMTRIVDEIKKTIGNSEVVAVFHADCLARGRFLFNRIIKEELVGRMQFPFYNDKGECPPWLGMYGFGEFARLGGKNTYHNYTTALYVLYRSKK